MKLNHPLAGQPIKSDHICKIRIIGLSPHEMKTRAANSIPIEESEIYESFFFSGSADVLDMNVIIR